MNKELFIKTLGQKTVSIDDKIKVCQFYIDNYPVKIDAGFGQKVFTKIHGLVINGGSEKAINFAFNKLKKRIKELKEFEIN